MAERGSDAFTLADVARRAGVSVGSIYGRVDSKDDLIRSVQARELARIDQESLRAFSRAAANGPDFESVVGSTIRATGEVLRRNAAVLGPLMLRANVDPVVAAGGRAAHDAMRQRFVSQVLAHSDVITRPDSRAAVTWTFTVVYSVIARYLGLGSSPESAGQGAWKAMLANLSEMTVSFLTRPI
jgi:AcrR family transcriptional regulator